MLGSQCQRQNYSFHVHCMGKDNVGTVVEVLKFGHQYSCNDGQDKQDGPITEELKNTWSSTLAPAFNIFPVAWVCCIGLWSRTILLTIYFCKVVIINLCTFEITLYMNIVTNEHMIWITYIQQQCYARLSRTNSVELYYNVHNTPNL